MKKSQRRLVTVLLIFALFISNFVIQSVNTTNAATKKTKSNKTSIKTVYLDVGETETLKTKKTAAKRFKWSSSDNKVAMVNSKGKVFATGEGVTRITVYDSRNFNKTKAIYKVIVQEGEFSAAGYYKNTKWSIDFYGTLSVKGTGDMYPKNDYPQWIIFDAEDKISNAKINVKGTTHLDGLFKHCINLEKVDIKNMDTSKVTTMEAMFQDCKKLTNLDVSKFNTSKVTNMEYMFENCEMLTNLDVSKFDTSKVKNMDNMFAGCKALTNLDVSNFYTPNVTSMNSMFTSCNSLTSLDLKNFNTSNVTDMGSMFEECTKLTKVNVNSFDTSRVYNMHHMFYDTNLETLDLSSFDISQVIDMDELYNLGYQKGDNINNYICQSKYFEMFGDCPYLTTICTPKKTGNVVPELPSGVWRDSNKKIYSIFPRNATQSITLTY